MNIRKEGYNVYVCLSVCLFYILSFTLDFVLIQCIFGTSFPPVKKFILKLPVCYMYALPFFCVSTLYRNNLKSHIEFSLARRSWFHRPEDIGRKGQVIQALLVNIGRIPKAIFIVKDWETCESVLCQIHIDLILSWSNFSDFVANIEWEGSSVYVSKSPLFSFPNGKLIRLRH